MLIGYPLMLNVLGNIDPLAAGYAGWQETYTVTPNPTVFHGSIGFSHHTSQFYPVHPSISGS